MEFSGCPKRHDDGAPSCPRCASSNTKFCYFNNYSFSQPRYFCKSCRRYWTKGGSLRNVPVGGASRKSRPAKPSRHSPQNSGHSISVISCSHNTPNSGDAASGGSHIDMALLFANFINQNSTSYQEFHRQSINGSSDSVTSESAEAQKDESRRLSDPVADCDHDLIEALPQQEAARNFSEYELDGLFGADEAVQDVLWSDDTTLSALAWQPPSPMMAFPLELEYSMSTTTAMPFHDDDQFPITSTVLPPI